MYIRNILSISIIFAGGQNVPSYFVYDKGCALLQHVAAGDNIPGRNEVLGVDQYAYLCNDATWLVDRFHFLGHSTTDEVCRENCCPFALENRGLVLHRSRNQVVDGGPAELQTRLGVRRIVREGGRQVRKRVVRRIEGEQGDTWFEYDLEDVANTEVCEQVFSKFKGYAHIIRGCKRPLAELIIRVMIEKHNETKYRDLQSANPPIIARGERREHIMPTWVREMCSMWLPFHLRR